MKVNWLNFLIYLGMVIIGCLFCWWVIKYLCIVIAWLMMCL
jgi:hypothetical protein